jgi:hypothetical protein
VYLISIKRLQSILHMVLVQRAVLNNLLYDLLELASVDYSRKRSEELFLFHHLISGFGYHFCYVLHLLQVGLDVLERSFYLLHKQFN